MKPGTDARVETGIPGLGPCKIKPKESVMPPTHFCSESYDTTTKILSTIVCIAFVVITFLSKSAAIAGIGAALIALCYVYSPRSCVVSQEAIVVNRLIGSVRLPLDGIREARPATAEDFRGCLRLWGSGGMFGYYGLFRTSKLGRCWWYVTNRRNAVVVITAAKTVLFSPDDVGGFLAAIRAAVPVPVSGVIPGQVQPESRPSSSAGTLIVKLIAAAFGLAGILFAVLAVLYSPGPPSYTLTSTSLTINDRFYPVTLNAADVDVEHIQVVDIARDRDWWPTSRTNGFANSHYRSGWFRLANGQQVRLYRADGTRLVLLPPKGDHAPVLMETRDPEKFVEEVQRAWSRSF